MRSKVLDAVLKNYINEYKEGKRIVFVLPSRRSVFYAKHSLRSIYQNNHITHLFPEIITINEFIENICQLIVLSNIDLIYYLYQSYKKNFKEDASPYHTFIKWSNTLLNDFNDIVISYPHDEKIQKAIFTNLKEIKEIEYWSLKQEPLSENQEKYLGLMEKFYLIFDDFNTTLLGKGWAYPALSYESAIKNIEKNNYLNSVEQFVFAGFNALTSAEKIIFNYLKKNKKAEFYWDYDTYYTENRLHEAGYFLRENLKEFGNELKHTSYFDQSKNIYLVSSTNEAEEALYIKKTLIELQKQNPDLQNTAIILNKAENLNLIRSAIPENVHYNISMEYPLYLTSAYQFFAQMMRIAVQLSNTSSYQQIYHKLFINLILNPFFKLFAYKQFNLKESALLRMVQTIKKQNIIYIDIQNSKVFNLIEEQNVRESFLNFLNVFTADSSSDFISQINQLLHDYLYNLTNSEVKDMFTINVLQSICEQLNRIEEILKKDNDSTFVDIKDVYALVQQIVSKEAVAFKGEPLSGLQIIGLLESRLLDFETIIIPFMNEGIFPPDHKKVSFLPYDVRMHYKLVTHHHEDAIFSYLFYRNLHAPSDIYLSYNHSSKKEEKGLRQSAGEYSRYIQQILFELSEKKNINIQNLSICIQNKSMDTLPVIEIEKDNAIIQKLKDITYSPTNVITYLDCSLKFYFRYILSLKKTDETSEKLEADMIGKIFHQVMSQLYSDKRYLDKNNYLSANALKSLIDENSNVIIEMIKNCIHEYNLEHKGEVLINEVILSRKIKRFIEKEIKFIEKNKIKIIKVEQQNETIFDNDIRLNIDDTDFVKISGIPDRIDLMNDKIYRVVDYKSSFSKYDNMKFNELKLYMEGEYDNIGKKNFNKQLQLLIYIFYAKEKSILQKNTNITGLILPLNIKNYDKNFNNYDINQYILNEDEIEIFNAKNLNEINNLLIKIFKDYILNSHLPFSQTTNTNICMFCDFIDICKRRV